MDLLYGNQRKALKLIYRSYKKDAKLTKVMLSKFLKLNFQETTKICNELRNKNLISLVGLNYDPKITINGIDYFSTEIGEWLKNNIIAILALIISLISLIVSIFK